MVYCVSAFRVLLLLWTLLIASTNANKIKGHLPDVGTISSFLEQFIKPYIDIQINSSKLLKGSDKETNIEKVITHKVAGLKRMLQDREDNQKPKFETENNLTLEGNEETTIIEFMPKNFKKTKEKSSLRENKQETDSFEKNIKKYKQLRQNIKKMLDKEKTAISTKKLITRTLDEMIAQLIERQCTWKNVNTSGLKNHLFKGPLDTRKSLNHLKKLSNKDWMNLRRQYLDFLRFNSDKDDDFFKQFQDFFTNVIKDTWNLAYRYQVRCQLVKLDDSSVLKDVLRVGKTLEKNQCDSFKVCSDELKDFLTKFYSDLNDTAVSTFSNYAAMYVRDVKAEIDDKDVVVSVIENLSNTAEKKVNKIFRKETGNFKLDDDKKKIANIQHISDFITATTNQVKNVLRKILDYELSAMKTKVFATVKDDLNVNLKVDMDNLGRSYVEKICSHFVLCNGRNAARRSDKPSAIRSKDSNIYVKVQLTLDDELQDSIARLGMQKPWRGNDMTRRLIKHFDSNEIKYSHINVTRTSISPTTTSLSTTTEIIPTTPLPTKKIKKNLKEKKILVKNGI